DAPVVDGRREAGDVGDEAAPDRDDPVGAGEAPARPGPAQLLDRGQRLGLLALADREHLVLAAGVDLEPDGGLGDDGDPPDLAEHLRQPAPRPRPHEDRVAAAAGADGDGVGGHGDATGVPVTSAAMWRASARLGFSSPWWKGSTSTARSATSS